MVDGFVLLLSGWLVAEADFVAGLGLSLARASSLA